MTFNVFSSKNYFEKCSYPIFNPILENKNKKENKKTKKIHY